MIREEIEYLVQDTVDTYTDGVTEKRKEWLCNEVEMIYGQEELNQDLETEIRVYIMNEC